MLTISRGRHSLKALSKLHQNFLDTSSWRTVVNADDLYDEPVDEKVPKEEPAHC